MDMADSRRHRHEIVERLRARGLSTQALEILLPGWSAADQNSAVGQDGGAAVSAPGWHLADHAPLKRPVGRRSD
jgi:hypothetical protein